MSPSSRSDVGFSRYSVDSVYDDTVLGDGAVAGPSGIDTSGYGTGSDEANLHCPEVLDLVSVVSEDQDSISGNKENENDSDSVIVVEILSPRRSHGPLVELN